MTVKRNNVMYRGERRRVTRQILKNPIKRDVTKETTAFIANLIHATDAIFLREIYLYCHRNNIYISTVHDEFILPVNNLFEFIEISSHIYEDMYYEINKKKINVTSSFIFL
jgi:DNA-directed RNA polymerase